MLLAEPATLEQALDEARGGTVEVVSLVLGGHSLTVPAGSDRPGAAVVSAGSRSLLDGRVRTVGDGRLTWTVAPLAGTIPGIVGLASSAAPPSPLGCRELARSAAALVADLGVRDPFLPLLASSPALAETLQPLRAAAPTRIPVLVLGETGTGKEVVARAVHRASRRPGAFVAENCAALPETLLEAELFGVRRGAFTGATSDRRGRLLDAHGGTLLLDEVGDLQPTLQAKLLRVLQDGEVRPLGGDRAQPVDLRVVAATHRAIDVVDTGFRRDLFYRLAGLVVRLPALRDRRADVPWLAAALLARAEAEGLGPGRWLTAGAQDALLRARLPGNVRELDSLLRRAMVLSRTATIDEDCVVPTVINAPPAPGAMNLEARAIVEALSLAHGVKADAARRLGWSRQRLYRRLEKLGLPTGDRLS